MFKFLKEFFHLSNTELKGANVLLFLIALVFLAPRVYFYFQKSEIVEDVGFSKWVAKMNFKEDSTIAFIKDQEENKVVEIELFNFDPNTVTYKEMIRLGFEGKTANILIKFREKGAEFYSKKDLKKIYGFTEELYIKLEDYIDIPNDKNQVEKDKKIKKSLFPFNPNTVSYSKMMQLGIDGKTANVLIKFRNKGAKFYEKKDLLKIYGFSEELYSKLENYIIFSKKPKYEKALFHFDPNTVSYLEMIKLGIDGKTANILIKYRGNKTSFYNKSDLLKVFGFTEEKFVELEAYIDFPSKEFISNKEGKTKINYYDNLQIDINKASAKDLEKLIGVGAYISKEIVKYRIKLGGFYAKEQLKEVYGITEEVFVGLSKNIVLNNPRIKKINLNTTSFKQLVQHPYISKELTIKILKLHKELGGFNKIEDIKYYDLLSKEEFENLKHYLKVK